jgi:hypothetical protein
MGFRFRRSIRLLPGIRVNLSKSGASASVGVRGAHVTVGHGKVRETVGLPGSGLSHTHLERTHQAHQDAQGETQAQPLPSGLPKGNAVRGWLWIALMLAIALCIVLLNLR